MNGTNMTEILNNTIEVIIPEIIPTSSTCMLRFTTEGFLGTLNNFLCVITNTIETQIMKSPSTASVIILVLIFLLIYFWRKR